MQYKWAQDPQGQFVDGHEWEDIVTYLQQVFLPCWEKLEHTMHKWGDADLEKLPHGHEMCHMVVWHHDEATYNANDWHMICWVHWGEQAVPYAKGEGLSLMVVLPRWKPAGIQSQEGPGRLFHQQLYPPEQLSVRKPCFCF